MPPKKRHLTGVMGQMCRVCPGGQKDAEVPPEGEQSTLDAPCSDSMPSPRRLRFKVINSNKLHILWKEPKGAFDKYKFLYNYLPGGHPREIDVPKSESKVIITDYNPAKDYIVHVIAVKGSQQSKPLQGTHKAEQTDSDKGGETQPQRLRETDAPPDEANEISGVDPFVCHTEAVADIVILVDGSWSIGRINFRLVRLFLENLVNAFDIGIDKTRIGLAQYSGDPRIEWHLNAYTTKDTVIDAVKNLPYKGGNTLTGLALTYILENSFKPESGSRPGVPKIGILITDGKSQDDVVPPAESLRDAGVELFAVGVKNADENELQSIASEPDEGHVYNVADFSIMSSIVEGLTKIVCEQVQHQDKEIKTKLPLEPIEQPETGAPSDFLASEVTANSFRVTWSPAPGKVEKYRVVYYPAQGGRPDELVVDGGESSVLLEHLSSQTLYEVAVFAVYATAASEALRGSADTLVLATVSRLELLDMSPSAMRARWSAVAGASGYMLLYAPLTGEGDAEEKELKVSEAITELELEGLIPDTEYSVTVYALYGEEASDPVTHQETTLPLSPPSNLQFSEITHNSAHINWEPPQRVKGYRISWVKADGLVEEEVEVGPVSSYDIGDLTSLMEYSVAVSALYDEGQSESLTDGFTTNPVPGPLGLRASDVSEDSMRVSWDHSANDVVLYKLSWAPFTGGDAKEVILSGSVDSYALTGLRPSTEYEAMLTAVFKDKSESDAVAVMATTLARTTTIAPTTAAPRHAPRNLQVGERTTHSLEASWVLEDPLVEGYRVSYATPERTHSPEVVFLPAGSSSVLLQPLVPDTWYKVTLTPLYPDGHDGVSAATQGATLPLSSPSNLRVSEEWYNRFRLTWDPPTSPPTGYRVVYQPMTAPAPALDTVVGANVNSVVVPNLQSGTEYSVQVSASFPTTNSEPALGTAKTLFLGVSGLSTYQVRPNSMCVQWQPLSHATMYRASIQSTLSKYQTYKALYYIHYICMYI
ncbi:collagen alpha-1(XIV) chain [Gadus macrocephalus]|uniref:collagen alpha-1(XIV) chain n=1 Tax=Gadus macrocephalus TaxID=80720 RepID=UPI0028CB19BC|nr:collagen alpha-1(XIV) chain [Gadus macrocephalus]